MRHLGSIFEARMRKLGRGILYHYQLMLNVLACQNVDYKTILLGVGIDEVCLFYTT